MSDQCVHRFKIISEQKEGKYKNNGAGQTRMWKWRVVCIMLQTWSSESTNI